MYFIDEEQDEKKHYLVCGEKIYGLHGYRNGR